MNGYFLAGDPVYLAASVRSYYDAVRRIVVSYDADNLSWGGHPLDMSDSLRQAVSFDPDNKIELLPGHHSNPDRPLLDCETRQRQAALDHAARDADWVLQLDSDEIVPDLDAVLTCLHQADRAGAMALDYPARWLYSVSRRDTYLESSRRFWGVAASYPGPVAVRAGTQLRHCRQCSAEHFRVDLRARNTDPWRSSSAPVHRVVSHKQAILHFSWVRHVSELKAKAILSGHADTLDWEQAIQRWQWRGRHPWLASILTPTRRAGHQQWLRPTRIPASILDLAQSGMRVSEERYHHGAQR